MLAVFLFQTTGIGHSLLDYLKIHQRLSAEKIYLQVTAPHRFFHQEINGRLGNLKAHDLVRSAVRTLSCKAITAPQIAVMGHVQTHSLER